MVTDRQKIANRGNAAKSTGPRSKAGKQRAAQNARRHGLTQTPDAASILRWYRIIQNDPTAETQGALQSERARAALALAEAEAHLGRTRDAEQAHLDKMMSVAISRGRRSLFELVQVPEAERYEDDDILNYMIKNYSDPELDIEDRDFFVQTLKIFKRLNPNRPAELNRLMSTFRRYRKRAEGRRNRAFSAWMRAMDA